VIVSAAACFAAATVNTHTVASSAHFERSVRKAIMFVSMVGSAGRVRGPGAQSCTNRAASYLNRSTFEIFV
jgi:hypothetical protein